MAADSGADAGAPDRSVSPGGVTGWTELQVEPIAEWSKLLLATDASLFQLPYWNESLRLLHFRPRYLTYQSGGHVCGYICVLEVGPPGARIGLVPRGPVTLTGKQLPTSSLQEFTAWARKRGYAFLRVTHHDDAVLADWSSLAGARRVDAFPFYREPQEELLVQQLDDDAATMSNFQPVGRRNLRRAQEAGYEIESTDTPAALTTVWPLFQTLSARKGFRYRPLESFGRLMELGRQARAVRLFVARLDGRAVEAILVARDRKTAHYIIGALDTAALDDRESPSVLLHWHAMREFAREGAGFYDLGTRSGPVYTFKRKFRPVERQLSPPVTVVLNRPLFLLWSTLALGVARRLWPRFKRVLFR
jgi:GNAT acetyltransferase-like protein